MLLITTSGISFFLALLCFGVLCVVYCRGFYHMLVTPLDIVSESGLPKELILRNYDCLIDYCSPFFKGGLSFPDFPSSDSALSHFAETKILFSWFYLAVPGGILLGSLLVYVHAWRKQKGKLGQEFSRALRLTMWLCFLVPVFCFVLFFTDFHKVFYGMHHIFFRNNDWLFDAATDPVITILPERYFLCCGVFIALFLLIATPGIALLRKRIAGFSIQRNRKERMEGQSKKGNYNFPP